MQDTENNRKMQEEIIVYAKTPMYRKRMIVGIDTERCCVCGERFTVGKEYYEATKGGEKRHCWDLNCGCKEKVVSRPEKREDGWLTRNDMLLWSPAEKAIQDAVNVVESAGASKALTDAVILLQKAKDRVADHMEGKE